MILHINVFNLGLTLSILGEDNASLIVSIEYSSYDMICNS